MSTRFSCADPLLYADMRQALLLDAKVLYDAPDGLLLRRESKLFAAGEAIERLPAFLQSGMALIRDEALNRRMMQQERFAESLEVVQLVYTGRRPEPVACPAQIRRMELSDMDFVLRSYHHPNSRPAYIKARIRELMLGAYIGGEPVGCIGVHEEGAMGMLEVLPAYRRMGIGRALETALIQWLTDRGRIAYCHVAPDNEVSLRLQADLGLKACAQPLYWLYKPL